MASLPILYRIQELESRLRVLKQSEEQLLKNPRLADLEVLLKKLNSVLINAETDLNSIRSSQRQLDLDLKSGQERLQIEENRLYSGATSSSRELEQIQQKAAEYRKTKEHLEDRILKLMDEDEKLIIEISKLKSQMDTFNQELLLVKKETRQKITEISLESQDLQTELGQIINQVPADWLQRYQRIAKAHNGIGIAKMKANSCGACHVSLSESFLQRVKHGADTLLFCENCGRILYY